jgi:hypothetical protein
MDHQPSDDLQMEQMVNWERMVETVRRRRAVLCGSTRHPGYATPECLIRREGTAPAARGGGGWIHQRPAYMRLAVCGL